MGFLAYFFCNNNKGIIYKQNEEDVRKNSKVVMDLWFSIWTLNIPNMENSNYGICRWKLLYFWWRRFVHCGVGREV